MEVALGRLQPERVQAHLLTRRAERDDAQRLRLATSEQRRSVRAWSDSDFDRDRPDLVRAAAVRALLLDRDPLADQRLLELVEGALRVALELGVGLGLRVAGVLHEHLLLDRLARVLALELVLDLRGGVERRAVRGLDLLVELRVHLRDLDLELRLAGLLGQLALDAQSFLISLVGDVERVEDLGLWDLAGAGLDHQDRLVGAGHDQVELGVLGEVLLVGVDDEVAVDLADPYRADRGRQRHLRDHQRRGGAVHRKDVVRVDVIDRDRQRDQLGLVAPALGKQRPDRAVDQARGQRRLLPRAPLALEE